ncbi:MAG: hotdog fold thioesterase [Rhizomicrobium sp.]
MNEADTLARRVADRLHAQEATAAAWNIEIEEVREGYSRVAMIVRADMINGHAIAHGGMIFALADTAFAYACNSRNVETVAQNATIAFLARVGWETGWWQRLGNKRFPAALAFTPSRFATIRAKKSRFSRVFLVQSEERFCQTIN